MKPTNSIVAHQSLMSGRPRGTCYFMYSRKMLSHVGNGAGGERGRGLAYFQGTLAGWIVRSYSEEAPRH